ncbi:MAG: hypothetical protein WC725_03975 [Patescibacteria group bacterium]|jgi:hypothetical protein
MSEDGEYNLDEGPEKDNFEDESNLSSPPPAGNPRQQDDIATEMASWQNPAIHKADIIVDKPSGTGGEPNKVPEGQEAEIANQQQIQRQQAQNQAMLRQSANAGLNDSSGKIKGDLFSGDTAAILKTIPGIGGSLSAFKVSDLGGRIKILKKLDRRLKIAKSGAAIADATITWVEAFTASLPIFIVGPLIMILIAPFWLLIFMVFQEKVPLARLSKVVSKATKQVSKALKQYLMAAQDEQQRQEAQEESLVQQAQFNNLPAANEPTAGQKAA